jgi:hypothetical protein
MKTRTDHSAVATPAFIAPQSFNVLTKYQINGKLQIGGQATYRSSMPGGAPWPRMRTLCCSAIGGGAPFVLVAPGRAVDVELAPKY